MTGPAKLVKPARGKFIVLEGLDGAGTSTQQVLLVDWLMRLGQPVEATHEPTNGPIGSVIRQVLDGRLNVTPKVLAMMFATDRLDHITNPVNGIEVALSDGRWVVCDRYVFSSLAYQSADGIDAESIISLNRWAIDPDLTIFVDTDPVVCMDRIRTRSGYDELYHKEAALVASLDAYQRIIATHKLTGTILTVDGNNKVEDVADEIRTKITKYFGDDDAPWGSTSQLSTRD